MGDRKPLPLPGRNSKISLVKLVTTSNATRTLVPPVLHEVGKLAAGVAAVSAGSATGNPRNKCALQPGHSLMDWIRLGSSGRDLTGVGDRAGHIAITPNQLALHDKETDAWLAIRGKVYNVTAYLPFHPGGPDELMKGAGRDATNLFDQIHPWVNYDSILQKCFIGKLVPIDPSINSEAIFLGRERLSSSTQSPLGAPPPPPPTFSPAPSAPTPPPPVLDSPSTATSSDNTTNGSQSSMPLLPRFDWIQKLDSITIIFYTRSFSNPHVTISSPNAENVLNIFFTYDGLIFTNELKFADRIHWPCQIKVFGETGKVEVQFRKAERKIWGNYGVLKQKSDEHASTEDKTHSYKVISKVRVNHNTFLMEFERLDSFKTVAPVGKHVRVFGDINGEKISRSYTPVPCSLQSKFKVQTSTTSNMCLMVKRYPEGNISRYICDKDISDTIKISSPLGAFELQELDNRETFLMLAAGTGITPMFGLILFLLERRVRKCRCISLLFFNKTEEDILFRDQLESLQNEDCRFMFKAILSQPDPGWQGSTGHVTKQILQETIGKHTDDTGYTKSDVFVTVCGPTLFTNLAQNLLTDLEFKKEQVYLFLG